MALTVPNGPATKTTIYTDLRGVDFSQDASLVDRQHSPDMVNMISDEGGSPIKRKGWEILFEDGSDVIYDIWHFTLNETDYFACCHKATVQGVEQVAVNIFDPETGTFGAGINYPVTTYGSFVSANGFFMNDGFYIFFQGSLKAACGKYILSNGALTYSGVEPKIPIVLIGRSPANGGGTMYEDLNLLTTYRTEQFIDTGSGSTTFVLATTDTPSDLKLWYKDSSGEWVRDNTATVTTSGTKKMAKITTAHSVQAANQDNIRVTYTATPANYDGEKVKACPNSGFFSHGGLDQVFVTGNPKYPNYVWYSDYGDPSYFPDLNYIVVGSGGTKCMGFLNVGDNLAVVKEQSEQDSGLYFIYETSMTSTTVNTSTGSETTQNYAYALRRSSSGVGAISNRCFSTLQDEPLFLSEDGVQGIVSTNVISEKVVRNRSRHIDRKLLSESNLEKAISCVNNGYYYVFINGNVYILDSRHATSDRRGNTNYVYEAYYWNNVPANCVCVANDTIYFGTADGKICRFKNTDQLTDYSDGSHYDSDEDKQVGGVPITAVYATRNDDDDAPQFFKTMMKKGSMLTVAPFANSSVEVYLRVDSSNRRSITDGEVTVSSITTIGSMPMFSTLITNTNLAISWEEGTALGGKYTAALVNSGIQYVGSWIAEEGELFTNVDFEHLAFDMRSGPRDFFFRKKKKKYIRLQFVFVNNEINEGFGIHNIVKTYSLTRYAK